MTLERPVERQGGVVSLAQALECGMSAATVRRRVREGRWKRLHPAVYLVGGRRYTSEARIRAAFLWAGPAAVVCGPAAAYWHRMLERLPAAVDLTVPARVKPKPQPGVRIRRRDLCPADVSRRGGVLVAAKPFAALEAAVANPISEIRETRVLAP